MNAVPRTIPLPSRVLLATDLSPRCDRALDRSVQLGRDWGARLTVLNVLDAPDAPDRILDWAAGGGLDGMHEDARRQIARELASLDASGEVRLVRSRDAAATIREVAAETGAGLVVTGVARDEPLGRFRLGSTVEQLARAVAQPILIVRSRPLGPYQRIVVATDLSSASGAALALAARWFAGGELRLFHARAEAGQPFSAARSTELKPAGAAVEALCERFIADSGVSRAAVRNVVAVDGSLESAVTRYVRLHDIDLVVMGGHESAGFLDALAGSSLERVLQWVPCDVLVVPPAGEPT